MKNRRTFLKLASLSSLAVMAKGFSQTLKTTPPQNKTNFINQKPIVISTWIHGMQANAGAWEVLTKGGKAIDAVQRGVMVVESDVENQSVGLGGLPDRDGIVTLDACIMDENNRCGAVACLQNIENPIAVARKVMDETPHVLLVGEGALQFALEKGFKSVNLLTEKSKKDWESWKVKSKYQPVINSENHDTIGMLALDAEGNLSGSCTTSGMAYKLHGRVGDSPIIGAGLFVDNEVGAACATGMGEAVIRIAGSAVVVELMRQGMSPSEACKTAVNRIIKKHKDLTNLQVGFLALNKQGEHGGYSVYNGFNYALRTQTQNEMVNAKFDRTW
ncbi:MAG: glycosylasparaginase [Flavobacteriales bacterium CG03_land_8_20_14_0_80_35_15]|nr:N(4)-(beta-N-acetylglucosaminyl)-L-asparaginase [Zetaproteobacteria bacterium]OIO13119.1 MAG: glycosylasparaginase [Flavobacteriaceae bacterium CG1_02_35_72]PIR13708.1 MAG: glycosylasparaginase [Flavobacteriales bacterium CG11_big_fil_rev_8_21_14_0_20_35_7]PIV17399.1 MAG: glycosylasparaginase [Flavobacteriales bacterium CG03_land_8_20_14_0_80_35_15]PIX06680.1 MAG: glycosylasparaginase [Flavobacteriales bacterium CG_4_8_14_3_um_filter_35_10]PJA04844.1 MAG: glycosylasparaginase [Flavobacteria